MTTPLDTIRTVIAGLDETIVRTLHSRGRFRQNLHLYRVATRASAEPVSVLDTAHTVALRNQYIETVLPVLCHEGRDAEARKCLALDTVLLDAVGRRLHLATLVATQKFGGHPEKLKALADGGPAAIEAAIVRPSVEAAVLRRAEELAEAEAGKPGLGPAPAPTTLAAIYRDWILPMSRQVQRECLLRQVRALGTGRPV